MPLNLQDQPFTHNPSLFLLSWARFWGQRRVVRFWVSRASTKRWTFVEISSFPGCHVNGTDRPSTFREKTAGNETGEGETVEWITWVFTLFGSWDHYLDHLEGWRFVKETDIGRLTEQLFFKDSNFWSPIYPLESFLNSMILSTAVHSFEPTFDWPGHVMFKKNTFSAQEHPLRCSRTKLLPVAKAQAKNKNSMSSRLIPTGTTAPQARFDLFDHLWVAWIGEPCCNKPGVIQCHSWFLHVLHWWFLLVDLITAEH